MSSDSSSGGRQPPSTNIHQVQPPLPSSRKAARRHHNQSPKWQNQIFPLSSRLTPPAFPPPSPPPAGSVVAAAKTTDSPIAPFETIPRHISKRSSYALSSNSTSSSSSATIFPYSGNNKLIKQMRFDKDLIKRGERGGRSPITDHRLLLLNSLATGGGPFSSTSPVKNSSSSAAAVVQEEEQRIHPQPPVAPTLNISKLNPRAIRSYLEDYVIGQDMLKKTLSVAIFNASTNCEMESYTPPSLISIIIP